VVRETGPEGFETIWRRKIETTHGKRARGVQIVERLYAVIGPYRV